MRETLVSGQSWRQGITRYQWLVLFIAWLGWVFDAMDATIYAIVLHPALHDLLHSPGEQPPTPEQIGWYGGIIFSIFLIGWAIGGIFFGIVADHLGRTKTLITTIIIYAIFTGAAALSQTGGTWLSIAFSRHSESAGNGRPAQRSSLKHGRKRNERKPRAFCNRPGRSASFSLRRLIHC